MCRETQLSNTSYMLIVYTSSSTDEIVDLEVQTSLRLYLRRLFKKFKTLSFIRSYNFWEFNSGSRGTKKFAVIPLTTIKIFKTLSFIRSYNFWVLMIIITFSLLFITDFFYRFLGHLQEDPAREDRK